MGMKLITMALSLSGCASTGFNSKTGLGVLYTATAESVPFITAANVEAEGAELGIGIVRIMGHNCGFIAVDACLASRDVNICVIPEIHF